MVYKKFRDPRYLLGRILTVGSIIVCGSLAVIVPQEAAAAPKLNCMPVPSKCGYPDAKNTGPKKVIKVKKKKRVIKRKKLKGKKRFKYTKVSFKAIPDDVRSGNGWRWDSRGWVEIDEDGTTFKNYVVNGTIEVMADNVTIDNVDVIAGHNVFFGIALRRADNVVIKNARIGPASKNDQVSYGIKDIYGDSDNMVVSRSEIYGTKAGIEVYRGIIKNNYIHDMRYRSGDHLDGILSVGGSDLLRIVSNTIIVDFDQTAAIGIQEDHESNRFIKNNLIAGGGYTLYAAGTNIKVIGNRFSKIIWPRSGYWGPVAHYNSNGQGNVWLNNIWDDTGDPLN